MDDHTVTGRVVAILDVVADAGAPVTLADLTRATGIPKPTVRRIAADLVARRMLERDEYGYRLGPHMLLLGTRAAEQQGLAALATPHVHDLLARTHEIAWVGTVADRGVTLLNCAFGTNRAQLGRAFTRGFPLTHPALPATAMGRLLFAERPELTERFRGRPLPRMTRYTLATWPQLDAAIVAVRDTGLAVEQEQGALGYSCVAAPLRGADGSLIGMIGVTGRTPRLPLPRVATALRTAAADIGTALGKARPPANQAVITAGSPHRRA